MRGIVVLGAEFCEGDCRCRNKGELGETEVLFMNQALRSGSRQRGTDQSQLAEKELFHESGFYR